ncbi:MAG: bifunctional riboflavin kinase/FAD synthetase [Syntrophomonadaceae bacterium]
MHVIRGIENYQSKARPVCLALGNFDGGHKGHQLLIRTTVEKATARGGESAAFIFDPHPTQVLAPDKAPRLLMTPQRKAELLEKMGLDTLIYAPFTRDIAIWSPLDFVQRILIARFQVSEVCVGFNYTFGHRGSGTPETLQQYGQQLGFEVEIIAPVVFGGEPISSSLIRKALEDGDIDTAYNMLGHYPLVEGVVVEGEHRGATIGFPTANLGVAPVYHLPGKGVYAALAEVDSKVYQCVVNIGNKPTFHPEFPLAIEAHLIDFEGDLYGQSMRLSLRAKLRDEQRFASAGELVAQIGRDRERSLEITNPISRDSLNGLKPF